VHYILKRVYELIYASESREMEEQLEDGSEYIYMQVSLEMEEQLEDGSEYILE
jgi:hypothetical protein